MTGRAAKRAKVKPFPQPVEKFCTGPRGNDRDGRATSLAWRVLPAITKLRFRADRMTRPSEKETRHARASNPAPAPADRIEHSPLSGEVPRRPSPSDRDGERAKEKDRKNRTLGKRNASRP
jgi:hypothetical protein